MPLPLVAAGAARVAAGQAAKKLGGSAAKRGIARQIPGLAGNENAGQENDFPVLEWALVTVVAMLIDATVIILRVFDFVGIGTILAVPANIIAAVLCIGWSMLRMGKPNDGIWKKIPKWRFLGATATANTPFNFFVPAWTVYMLSLLFFR